jgi:hypothetical protein
MATCGCVDRDDFRYRWPEGEEDRIPNLQAWKAPDNLGGGIFAVGVNAKPATTFGRKRRYAGVFVVGAAGGSHRHVVNFNEDDMNGWAALIRGAGSSKRGFFKVGDGAARRL